MKTTLYKSIIIICLSIVFLTAKSQTSDVVYNSNNTSGSLTLLASDCQENYWCYYWEITVPANTPIQISTTLNYNFYLNIEVWNGSAYVSPFCSESSGSSTSTVITDGKIRVYSEDFMGMQIPTNNVFSINFQVDNSYSISENLYLKGDNIFANNSLKITTPYGYIDLGPKNSGFAHIYTDMPEFAINKRINLINGQLTSYANTNLSLQTGSGNTKMTILNSNGNVGIGTTNPNAKLDVGSGVISGANVGGLAVTGHNIDPYSINHLLPFQNSGKLILGWNYSGGRGEQSIIANSNPALAGGFSFYNYPYNGTAAAHLMTISGNGNVGIGSSNPTKILQVSKSDANTSLSLSNTSALELWNPIGSTNTGSQINFRSDACTGNAGIGAVIGYLNKSSTTSGSCGNIVFGVKSSASATTVNQAMTIQFDGNVGIGTTSPATPLDIEKDTDYQLRLGNNVGLGYNIGRNVGTGYLNFYGDQSGYNGYVFGGVDKTYMTIKNSGNVGIGTTNPSAQLEVFKEATTNGNDIIASFRRSSANTGGSSILRLEGNTSSADIEVNSGYTGAGIRYGSFFDLNIVNNNTFQPDLHGGINMITNGSVKMRVSPSGKVGIGLTDPTYTLSQTPATELLTVNGTIHAKEVNVSLDNLADYVFDSNYKLMPLSEVEQFVNTNKHLPSIPSATEVQTNGMNIGDMQNKMLQKIEELTLYMIDLKKTIDTQNVKIEQQSNRIKELENK